MSEFDTLKITSPAFSDGEKIPVRFTGRGEDVSPAFELNNLSPKTVSVAIIMDDLDIPFTSAYNHWVIWNLPPEANIPEAIPRGERAEKRGAVQGVGYGKNRYRGPLPPSFIKKPHRYRFGIYALDTKIELDGTSGKKALLRAMEGHILQYGSITGSFSNLDVNNKE